MVSAATGGPDGGCRFRGLYLPCRLSRCVDMMPRGHCSHTAASNLERSIMARVWTGRDLNSRPLACQASDLPLIYRPIQGAMYMLGLVKPCRCHRLRCPSLAVRIQSPSGLNTDLSKRHCNGFPQSRGNPRDGMRAPESPSRPRAVITRHCTDSQG
jgi:hypothetical protein